MNQSQYLATTCNSLKAREESRVCGAIGFGLASDWLKTGASLLSQSLNVTIAIAYLLSQSFENYSNAHVLMQE